MKIIKGNIIPKPFNINDVKAGDIFFASKNGELFGPYLRVYDYTINELRLGVIDLKSRVIMTVDTFDHYSIRIAKDAELHIGEY